VAWLYLRRFRPLAPLACAAAFALLWLVTGRDDVLRVAELLLVSVAAGMVYSLTARRFAHQTLVVSVFVDVLIVAALIIQLPNPERFSAALIWSVGVAAVLLGARETIVVAGLSAGMVTAVQAQAGGDVDWVAAASNAVIFLVVGALLAYIRRSEQQSQVALSRSKAMLEDAQRVARLGSWSWDIERDVVEWSSELYRIYGVPAGKLLTYAEISSFTHADERERARELVAKTLRTGEPYEVDVRIIRSSDGHERIVRARGERIEDRRGTRLLGTARDVTEERELKRRQDEFAATASHELRTPATVIGGFAETLVSRWDELTAENRKIFVTHIRDAARRLSGLIEDVLQVSRIESGTMQYQPRPVRIAQLVRQTLEHADTHPLDVRLEVGLGAEELEVMVDPGRIGQVLTNLLENAGRYAANGRRLDVVVGCPNHNGSVEVRVADAGPGIPAEQREHVFGRFVRLNAALEPQGTGLGLYISRQLAELHGGSLRLEETPGGGATFVLCVPRDAEQR